MLFTKEDHRVNPGNLVTISCLSLSLTRVIDHLMFWFLTGLKVSFLQVRELNLFSIGLTRSLHLRDNPLGMETGRLVPNM